MFVAAFRAITNRRSLLSCSVKDIKIGVAFIGFTIEKREVKAPINNVISSGIVRKVGCRLRYFVYIEQITVWRC